MPSEARNLFNDENLIDLPPSDVGDIASNDVKLSFQLLNKSFEVKTLDETLRHRRRDFQTRREHLQKRQEALHEREILFKERIISYEMYIKELAMKYDRSVRRMTDEQTLMENKRMEIDLLQREIDDIQEKKNQLQKRISQYQPHLNLLSQIVDRTDRFHSIDEMIENFDILFASYQDILSIIQNSNEQLNDLQRQLVLTMEKKVHRLSSMNNRIQELEENLLQIHHRTAKTQTEINTYQQVSIERLTEVGAIRIAIESMFDLVKRYSRKRGGNYELDLSHQLKEIDGFLGDLTSYIDYGNSKQKKSVSKEDVNEEVQPDEIFDANNRWRGPCERDRTIKATDQQSFYSYKIRGEDDRFYTIQLNRTKKLTASTLSTNRSSVSIVLSNQERKSNRMSTSKLPRSIDAQARSSITRSTRTTFQLPKESMPFSESDSIHRPSLSSSFQ